MFILLVEDEDFYADLIRMYLEQNGYTDIKHVDNALECLQQVRDDRVPDVIILDYNLGNLDGVSTLKQIIAYKPDLNVILLSGQKDVKVAVQSIKKGAREYVTKQGGEELGKVLAHIREIESEMLNKKATGPVRNFIKKVRNFLTDID